MTLSEKNFKILILSESVNFRQTLATKLRLEGFFVEILQGGFHLLHIMEVQRSIDMIILHEDMHDMSSYETISMVRNMKSKTELPILFVSKTRDEEEIYGLVLAGANEYIVHAANFQQILERTHKYFNQKKPAAA